MSTPSTSTRTRFHPGLEWLAFALLLVGEFLLFDRLGAKPHTRLYPMWNDQVQYLANAYTAYETFLHQGLGAWLRQVFLEPTAQGTLHDVYAGLIFMVAGPSRSAALAVNMLCFLAWQSGLFLSIRRLTQSSSLAWLAAALPLALTGPWAPMPGSTIDFRLDWMAAGLFGVCLSALVLSRGLRDARWSLAFGLCTAIVLLTRFLTGAYFFVIYAGLFIWVLTLPERRARLIHLFSAARLAALVAGPLMWLSRAAILEYYWSGHFTGPESAIRNQHFGLWSSFTWIAHYFLTLHAGETWLIGCSVLFVTVLGACGWNRRRDLFTPDATLLIPALLFLLSPGLVLLLHAQKMVQVLGIMLPGLCLLLLALLQRPWEGCTPALRKTISVVVVLLCLGSFVSAMRRPPFPPETLDGMARIRELYGLIATRSDELHLDRPAVATDHNSLHLDGQLMRIYVYETRRKWVPYDMTLPTGIAEADEADIFRRLAISDFVVIATRGHPTLYPFDRQLLSLQPRVLDWCSSNMRIISEKDALDLHLILYERASFPKQAPKQ